MDKDSRRAGDNRKIEITPAMVSAGVARMRRSLGEYEQSPGDFLVVLEILESALAAQKRGKRNSLTQSSKRKILTDVLRRL